MRLSLRLYDWWMTVALGVLLLLSFATLTSVAFSHGGDFSFVVKQGVALTLGALAVFFLVQRETSFFRGFADIIYWLGVAALFLVLFLGRSLNGTTGWFVLGGFALQPIEFMKPALALQLARFAGSLKNDHFSWLTLWGVGWRSGLPIVLLFCQPDLGGAVILFGLFIVTLLYLGLRFRYLVFLGGITLIAFWFGFTFFFQDYQKARVMTFLDPSSDPLKTGYNVNQAQIAIGAGGLLGRGLGGGTQSQLRFLPESQTDFIFAVIAEELGLLGVCIIFFAFLLLFWRLFVLAQTTPDTFVAALAFEGLTLFFVEFSLHIGVNTGLLPATGVTLPFVSYGGSSLLFSLMMFGVLQGASRNRAGG